MDVVFNNLGGRVMQGLSSGAHGLGLGTTVLNQETTPALRALFTLTVPFLGLFCRSSTQSDLFHESRELWTPQTYPFIETYWRGKGQLGTPCAFMELWRSLTCVLFRCFFVFVVSVSGVGMFMFDVHPFFFVFFTLCVACTIVLFRCFFVVLFCFVLFFCFFILFLSQV